MPFIKTPKAGDFQKFNGTQSFNSTQGNLRKHTSLFQHRVSVFI